MVTVYTTAPTAVDSSPKEFRGHLLDVARWTEASGCRGLLVYSDNSLADPWAIAQMIVANTETIVPMVAVQPVYMSPFAAARAVSTIGLLYGRQLDINLVTGGFSGHLRALDCSLDHDSRYRRLIEYGTVLRTLLSSERPVSYSGEFYRLRAASLSPRLDPCLLPTFFLSGSSPAGAGAQRELGLLRFAYPRLIDEYSGDPGALRGTGIRIGVIARPDPGDAWAVARQRFPADPAGEKMHNLASRVAESSWHRTLSADAQRSAGELDVYWLYPFRSYSTFCPYFVGSYPQVAELLARYLTAGVEAVILDEPASDTDIGHALTAIGMAQQQTCPS
jgi:alkanesulfonate monooxygenase